MSKMKGLLAAMIPLALMAENGFGQLDNNSKLSEKDIDFTPKQPPIPKGAKVYYFDEVGNCLYDVEHDTAVFKCIAINEKSAIKKFSKWLSAQVNYPPTANANTNVVGSLSFKEELQQNIIPAIDRMIGKEREHLKWLESNLGKSEVVVEFYNTSKKVLAHLEQRLIEYIDYAKKL